MKVKYVMFPENRFIILPLNMSHDSVGMGVRPVSAGFVWLTTTEDGNCEAEVAGESVSLGIKSRPEDAKTIAWYFSTCK